MNLERFLGDREARWRELDELLREARGKPERLGPARVLRLGELYRATAADLALARRRYPGDPVVAALESLVTRARQSVYSETSRRISPVAFFSRAYWRRVRERPLPLAIAAAFLLAPIALATLWALEDPGAAIGVVPEQFLATVEHPGGDQDLSASEGAAFSSAVFTNNIQVTFLALGAGLLFAIGTVAVLVFNGAIIGAVIGLTADAGRGDDLLEQVASHGVLELSCIVVTASAGLRLGWAIVAPGTRARGEALVEEARGALEIVLGTAPWLVLAGLVEGYVSPAGLGPGRALAVGLALGGLYWLLVVWRGARGAHEPSH